MPLETQGAEPPQHEIQPRWCAGIAALTVLSVLCGCDPSSTDPRDSAGGGAAAQGGSASGGAAGLGGAPLAAGAAGTTAGAGGVGQPSAGAGGGGGEPPEVDPCVPGRAGNPIVDGWYADPDMKVYDGVYWVYPTYSAPYGEQTHLDAFSSPDLIHWTKHEEVLAQSGVSWLSHALWAPSPIYRDGKYFLYFGANDIQSDDEFGGIGVATATSPAGPFADALGKPLIAGFFNGAQPIDQNVFIDDDGQAYLYYGGWGHCNVAKLNDDMKSLGTFEDGSTYKEITPEGYVEGALMFKRQGTYYFMWSEGGWTGPDYRVSYAMADSPLGPFDTLGTILAQNAAIATGSGHNTVVNVPGTDDWYIFYHRRPLGETDGNHRVLSYDRLVFRTDGTIAPVEMATEDHFCDDNDLGWQIHGGSWAVEDGRYRASSAEPEAKSLLDNHFAALSYEAEVSVGASGDAGLVLRVTEPTVSLDGYRGYYAGVSVASGRIVLGRADAGTWTELGAADVPLAAGASYSLRVLAVGADLQVYFSEAGQTATEPLLSVSDDTYAAGKTGLRAHGASADFDAIRVTVPH